MFVINTCATLALWKGPATAAVSRPRFAPCERVHFSPLASLCTLTDSLCRVRCVDRFIVYSFISSISPLGIISFVFLSNLTYISISREGENLSREVKPGVWAPPALSQPPAPQY